MRAARPAWALTLYVALFGTLCAAGAAGSAQAQTDSDEKALQLADSVAEVPTGRRSLRLFAEAGVNRGLRSPAGSTGTLAALDLRWEPSLSADLSLVFSDRLDIYRNVFPEDSRRDVNALRELYADWRIAPDASAQLGRINLRQGVAKGYNPTDFFRARALRSSISDDPEYRRVNRLGVVSVGGQRLWTSGAASAVLAPKLTRDPPSTNEFSADLGATNADDRALFTLTQDVGAGNKPQLSMLLARGAAPTYGLNATTLLGNSTVAYVEWSGGKSRTMLETALDLPAAPHFYQRVAAGLTYTTQNKLSLTAEYLFNGTGLNASDWRALLASGPPAVAGVLTLARDNVDPPSRGNVFLHAAWKEFLHPDLDLTAFCRLSAADGGKQYWLELRYRLGTKAEIYAQFERNGGAADSVYRFVPVEKSATAALRYYF